jgi:hypothetical protein
MPHDAVALAGHLTACLVSQLAERPQDGSGVGLNKPPGLGVALAGQAQRSDDPELAQLAGQLEEIFG